MATNRRVPAKQHAAARGVTLMPVPATPSVCVFPLDVSKPGVQRLLRAVAFVQRELDQQRVAVPVKRAS